MDLRQLSYFASAMRQGTLQRAADEHFVTQPAVSLQLKKLEREVGEKLFVRSGRRVRPTEAGRFLLQRADDILARVDDLKNDLARLKGLSSGVLRLGNIDAASIYVLPKVFSAFRRRYPGIDIRVLVADTDALVSALADGAIELAIVTLPLVARELDVVPIYEDRMVLVANPGHELVKSRRTRRDALRYVAERGLITYPARSTTRRLIEKVFVENGLVMRASMEMSSPEAIKRLTEAGLGASVLPREAVVSELRRGSLKVIATPSAFTRMLGVVHRKADVPSPPAKAFLDMLLRKYRVEADGMLS